MFAGTLAIAAALATSVVVVLIMLGTTLTNQRFEWQKKDSQRWQGTSFQYEVVLTAGKIYEIFISVASGGNTSCAGMIGGPST